MAKPKTKPDAPVILTEEDKKRAHDRTSQIIDRVSSIIWAAVILGGVYVIALAVFYWPIQVSAGKETTINVVQKITSDFKIDVALAWAVAGCGLAWGYAERSAKIRERKVKDERIAEMERTKDPNRTSSGLTPEGLPK